VRPYRYVVYEGPGAYENVSGIKSCYMVLLTDQMLVLKSKSKAKLLARIILLNANINELSENRNSKWQFGFQICTPKKNTNFYLDFDNECAKWIGFLEQTIQELPAILTKYPRDRDQLTILASKGKSESSGASGEIPMNAHVKEIITICEEIVKIQAELMQMPIDLRTMFPQFYAQLHPDHIHRLKSRIEQLGAKLKTLDMLNKRASELLKTEGLFLQVDKQISEALPLLNAMKVVVQKSFPPSAASRFPKGRDPLTLTRHVLFWYVKLCDAWQSVTDLGLSNP